MIYLKILLLVFFLWPLLLLTLLMKFRAVSSLKAGLAFTAVQLLSWWATVIGWFLLIRPCIKQSWVVDTDSIANELEPRVSKISRWTSGWLNTVWGNPQEGVSGQEAIIRDEQGNQIPYLPGADPRWRAYRWSALRNSCDGLKYIFEWNNGPIITFSIFGRSVRAGWLPMPQIKGSPRVPVLG